MSICEDCSQQYTHSSRYCHFTGEYYCKSCHINKSAQMPHRIFNCLDLRLWKCSEKSRLFLDKMFNIPVYRVTSEDVWENTRLFLMLRGCDKELFSLSEIITMIKTKEHKRKIIGTCRCGGVIFSANVKKCTICGILSHPFCAGECENCKKNRYNLLYGLMNDF